MTSQAKPARTLATTPKFFARIGRKTWPVASIKEASEAYRAAIDALGIGGSQTPSCTILDGSGAPWGHVSYNGRVWLGDGRDWKPGQRPVYDPCGA